MTRFLGSASQGARAIVTALVSVVFLTCVSFAQPTTVIVAAIEEPGSNSFVQRRAWFDHFEASNPDIKVELQYVDNVIVRILGGSPPDLFWVGNNAASLAAAGYLYDLTEFIERDNFDLDAFIPALVEAYSYNGRVYGLPNDSAPHIFYYNRGLLEEAGVNPDMLDLTWTSLIEVGKKLTKQGPDGEVVQWGFGPLFWNDMVMSWVWQNQGDLLNEEMTEPTVTTPEFREAIEYLYNLVYEHQIAPPYAVAYNPPPWERFLSEDVALLQQGAWLASTHLRDVDFEWGMLLPPVGKVRATGISYGGYAIPYNAEHPEEAWRVLKYMTSEEGQKFLIRQGFAALSSNRYVIQDPESVVLAFGNPKNPDLELNVIVEAALISRTLPSIPVMDSIGAVLGEELGRVWAQEVPVPSGLINLDQRIRAILSEAQ